METFLGKRITPVPIGKLLVEQGLITSTELERALKIQAKNGGRLGQVLLAEKVVTPMAMAEMVAQHHGKACVNLINAPIDPHVLNAQHLDDYVGLEVLPTGMKDGRMQLAATDISFPVIEWAFRKYGNNFDISITSPRDILWTVEQKFGTELDSQSRFLLSRNFPSRSTLVALTNLPKARALLTLLATLLLMILFPGTVLPGLFLAVNMLYGVTLVFKLLLFVRGARERVWETYKFLPELREQDLPVYTVLVPVYKEARSLPKLLESLQALDYPKTKLDVKLVVETDDLDTIEAAKALKPDVMVEIIRVPFSLPRTKPKACNYALRFARGEYVTIYDAEDQPDPKQLKKAVQAFQSLPKEVVCLQARLNYYNRDDNWLTKFFALEYAAWFDFMLPGLEQLDVPLPLGGTSNHISLVRLRELGQWDPYNVTEDADLGVRIALSGKRTAVLRSLTLEEAPAQIGSWMRQRTRWIKGYMQTWLVHMRHPREMYRAFGMRGVLGFHLFIGGPCFVFLTTPLMLLVSALALTGDLRIPFPDWQNHLAITVLAFGYITHSWYAYAALQARGWKHLTRYAFLFPFYWLLHSVASIRAIWQLFRQPFMWEKTQHGLSQSARNSEATAQEFVGPFKKVKP